MTFLNPLVLLGLIAAGIPILIHLLQLKKLRQVEFSSVRFLKEIQHASAKRVKLRDYLLLLLRTLAIAALVMAFSRPAVKGFLGANTRTSSAVIVDNTPSTTARNEYGEIASQIRTVAAGLLNSFHSGDNVGVIFASDPTDTNDRESTPEPKVLSARIARSEISHASVGYAAAIAEANRFLSGTGYVNKEIYLVGDMQRTEFRDPVRLAVSPNERIFFLKTEKSPNDNLSVSGVKLLDPVIEVNSPSEAEATVTNEGGADKTGVVAAMYIDGRKVAQGVIDVAARTSRVVKLAFSVPAEGFHQGEVEIQDNSIQSDNSCYFSFYAIRRLNVVIVGDEAGIDFIRSAVQAMTDSSTEIDTRVASPSQFVYSDLDGVDVVVVEAYPALAGSQNFVEKLERFAASGGGILLFAPAPDRIDPYASLVRGLGVGSVSKVVAGGRTGFFSIEYVDASADFFAGIFSGANSADQIKSRLVTKIFGGVAIEPNPFAKVLMTTSAGAFFLSRQFGDGYAFVVATGADTTSSNFPLSPFFPVMVQRALFYSAAVKLRPLNVYAGQETEYDYPRGGIKSARFFSPSGEKSEIIPEYTGGIARFRLTGLNIPGVYKLSAGNTLCDVCVNIDPRESDLAQEPDSGIREFAQKLGFAGDNIFVIRADRNSTETIGKLKRGTDLSSLFAGAALLLLIAEIFVSRMKTV